MADFIFTGLDNVAQGNNKDVLDDILASFVNYKKFPKVKYTYPISITQMNASITRVKQPVHDNVYFIFDNNGHCQYAGIKEDRKNINYRLKLHMLYNDTKSTDSCISKLFTDIAIKPLKDQVVYYKTYSIEPDWMAPAVESYFIDYLRGVNPPQGRWVDRK